MPVSLRELADRFDCELVGAEDIVVDNVAGLANAGPRSISFLSSSNFKRHLAATRAGAVILRSEDAGDCPVACLISDNPYAAYARIAAVIHPPTQPPPGESTCLPSETGMTTTITAGRCGRRTSSTFATRFRTGPYTCVLPSHRQ